MPLVRGQAKDRFEAFAAGAMDTLFRTGCLLTGDAGDAEDLVQETFLRVAKRWNRVESMDHRVAYARRILVNLVLDGAERRTRQRAELERRPRPSPPTRAPGVLCSRSTTWRSSAGRWPSCRRVSAPCWCCATGRTCPWPRSRTSWAAPRGRSRARRPGPRPGWPGSWPATGRPVRPQRERKVPHDDRGPGERAARHVRPERRRHRDLRADPGQAAAPPPAPGEPAARGRPGGRGGRGRDRRSAGRARSGGRPARPSGCLLHVPHARRVSPDRGQLGSVPGVRHRFPAPRAKAQAQDPANSSAMRAAASSAGGCIVLALAPPYTPTASVPDPEAPYAVHPVPVGRYRGLISHVSAESSPNRVSSAAWARVAPGHQPVRAAARRRRSVRDARGRRPGLSDSALIKIVAERAVILNLQQSIAGNRPRISDSSRVSLSAVPDAPMRRRCLARVAGQIGPAQLADTDVEEEVADVEGKARAAKVMNDQRRQDNQDDRHKNPEQPDQEARHTVTSRFSWPSAARQNGRYASN